MNIKIDRVTISDGIIYVEVIVPKRMSGGTRFDGTKFKSYIIDGRYRIIIERGKKLYVQKHDNSWHSYSDKNYDIIKKWWLENKRSVKNNIIRIIQGLLK